MVVFLSRSALTSIGSCAYKSYLSTMANPKVFFDVSIGGKAAGRINMEVNYRQIGLCSRRLSMIISGY